MNRVGVNLLWMVPGVVGGSETYMTRLLSGVAERDSEIDYTVFALPQFAGTNPRLERRLHVVYAPLTGQWKSFRIAGENTWLATQCRKKRIDLVHHAGGVVPIVHRSRPVLTIHDLQYLFYPEYFARTKLGYLRRMVPRSAEAARLILTPSEFTRRTVIERLGIDPSIVVVVPHGISPQPAASDGDVRARYGIEGPFFLYPAASYPHKNHLVLIEAFARLARIHPEATLVLTGARGWMEWRMARAMGDRIDAEIKAQGIGDRVRELGYVSYDDLDALYAHATAMVFPSRFEGFGAPALEAMSRGCPVIAADASALPETIGDAGRLVSPDNPEAWTQAMDDILTDEQNQILLAKAGRERAAEFTWSRSARILEEAYRHALETTL